jgi:lysine/ornithine N-monooxygenase
MHLCSTKSLPHRDSRSLSFEWHPDALVHGKQECHDTDHLHSLVTLHLIQENPTDSPYTVLCFLHLQLG